MSENKYSFSVYYLAGVLFIIYGLYQIYLNDLIESLLYLSTGGAFIVVGFLQNDMFPRYKKMLNALSWILIVVALLSFLYVLTIKPAVQ